MIRWLIQTIVDHPSLTAGRPPVGLLTPAETAHYQSYFSPQRRRDWLLGRWTAKHLVQMHMAASYGFRPLLASFSIEHDPGGAPFVASNEPAQYGTGEHGRFPMALSISHSHGYAFCALAADDTQRVRVGADIERVAAKPADFAEKFFTVAEQANLNSAPAHMHSLLTIATWGTKEAVLKAAHLGLRADLASVECIIDPTPTRHWSPLRVAVQPVTRQQSNARGGLRAWWRVIDNNLLPGTHFVLTLAAFGSRL